MGNEALLIEGDFDAEKDIEVLEKLLGQEVTEEGETLADSEPRGLSPQLSKEESKTDLELKPLPTHLEYAFLGDN